MKQSLQNFKKFLLFFALFVCAGNSPIKAQDVTNYYFFPSDIRDVRSINVDTAGNFYFYYFDANYFGHFGKLSTDGSVSVLASGNFYPESITLDKAGNLYFSDMNGMRGGIKKITPEGVVSDYFTSNSYLRSFVFDEAGNLYYIDDSYWPNQITKVNTEGIVSTYFSDPNIQPQFLTTDKLGNLFFSDRYNWPMRITKLAPDGTLTGIAVNNSYLEKLLTDDQGNIYFLDMNVWPNDIKRLSADGTFNSLTPPGSVNNPRDIALDKSGNLYFIDDIENKYVIRTIRNASAPCPDLPLPVARDTSVCAGTSILLSAGGFGELRWYDAPVNGNLLYTGSSFMTGVLTTSTSYYIESFICNSATPRTRLNVTLKAKPEITISGDTKGVDSVILTASGGASYLWSGGKYIQNAQNIFSGSGNYSVTVTSVDGCKDVAYADVAVYRPGLNKYGSVFSERTTNVNENGALAALTKIDKNGRIYQQRFDGLAPENASTSALEIKREFPASADGYYWIKNPNINGGNPFKIYADMTTDGGGWTLIMCNTSSAGWTNANAVLRNQTSPDNNGNYSIIAWADHLKSSSSGFQYMIDANQRKSYGGIWTANKPYSFVSKSNSNTDITLNTKFSNWNYFEGFGIGQRMPWYTNNTNDGFITTSTTGFGGAWWGTLVAAGSWSPAPWLSGNNGNLSMQNPGIIWYWVR